MRFLYAYLIGYFLLILGAGLALWQAGAFSRLGPIWVVIGFTMALGLGILLALTADKRRLTD
jgi:hypothetical protein